MMSVNDWPLGAVRLSLPASYSVFLFSLEKMASNPYNPPPAAHQHTVVIQPVVVRQPAVRSVRSSVTNASCWLHSADTSVIIIPDVSYSSTCVYIFIMFRPDANQSGSFTGHRLKNRPSGYIPKCPDAQMCFLSVHVCSPIQHLFSLH